MTRRHTLDRPLCFLLLAALLVSAAAGYCRWFLSMPAAPAITMAEPPHEVRDAPQAEYRPTVPPAPTSQPVRKAVLPEAPAHETPEPAEAVPLPAEAPLSAPVLPSEPASMARCLLIGDSRTVGIREYAGLEGADFFASTGLGPHKIGTARISVPGLGKLLLEDLLAARTYDRVYIMLGINEVGYPAGSTIKKYRALVEQIRTAQPEALIILQGNLHVTRAWSDSDPIINNPVLDAFNAETAALADGRTIFYLDPNPLFDGPDGGLSTEKCSDGAHLRARYYIEWGKWLSQQSGEILRSIQGADTE